MASCVESDLRQLFRDGKRFPPGTAWLCEPGMGSDTGLPDVWIPVVGFFPLELKRGENPISKFEPSQKKFHKLSLLRLCPTFCISIVNPTTAKGYRIRLVGGPAGGVLIAEFEREFSLEDSEKGSKEGLNYYSVRAWLEKSVARE